MPVSEPHFRLDAIESCAFVPMDGYGLGDLLALVGAIFPDPSDRQLFVSQVSSHEEDVGPGTLTLFELLTARHGAQDITDMLREQGLRPVGLSLTLMALLREPYRQCVTQFIALASGRRCGRNLRVPCMQRVGPHMELWSEWDRPRRGLWGRFFLFAAPL
jgi:hypothetical protein